MPTFNPAKAFQHLVKALPNGALALSLVTGLMFFSGCTPNGVQPANAPVAARTPEPVRANGGDWESSGGTGVACFEDAPSAASYDQLLRRREPVPDSLIERIKTLVVLEEWEKQDEAFIQGPSSEAIMADLMGRLRRTAPIFYRQLEAIGKQIHTDTWRPMTSLDPTFDASPRHRIRSLANPNCRMIQLAVRLSRIGERASGHEIHVYFDPRLRARLDASNKALLELHERIYVAGRAMDQGDSLYTRALTSKLMDEGTWEPRGDSIDEDEEAGRLAMRIQNLVNFHLGDYVYVFASVLAPETAQPFTAASRLKSFMSILDKERSMRRACTVEQTAGRTRLPIAERERIGRRCARALIELRDGRGLLTPEEAYVFVQQWGFGSQAYQGAFGGRFRSYLRTPNHQLMMFDWEEPEMQELSRRALSGGCDALDRPDFAPVNEGVTADAAKLYCQGLRERGLIPRSTTGTDQN